MIAILRFHGFLLGLHTLMLATLSSICTVGLLGMVIRSAIWTRRFLDQFANTPPVDSVIPETISPRAVIILPVRGEDPFLARCIESLLDQNYPDYVLRIVIDSESDPSLPVIEKAVAMYSTDKVQVEYLHDIRETCGAKNSSLL